MPISKQLKTLGLFFADLVFPVYCLVCGKDGQFLCADCQTKLERLENQLCAVCQKPSPFGKTHPECASKNKLDGIVSALSYRNPKVSRLIEIYKYKFITDLGPQFSQLIVEAIANQGLQDYFAEFTILPVPLHKRRHNWRGFNQAELIGSQLSADLNLKLNSQLIHRSRFTRPQTQLNREGRLQNIQNAFEAARPVSGKFLLVDDVVTTGATLNEIAKVLKKSGASEVWAVTVAHG